MSKKAVDIVLLSKAAIMYKIIELNRLLVEKSGSEIVLNKESCLPHISLAMGCVEEEDISAVAASLKRIGRGIAPRQLRTAGVTVTETLSGEKVSSLEIEKTEKLQELHETVTVEMETYFTYDVTKDMVYPSGEVAESTLRWIRQYRARASFENFRPHITLGYGELEEVKFPEKIEVSRLAACLLGNHCTCRRILTGVKL